MPDAIARYESMIFDYGTTNLTDYRNTEIEPPVATTYKAKQGCVAIRPPPLKDVHTLSNWKGQPIPFDLLHEPRPIVQTNPWKVQKKYCAPGDPGLEEAIRTRPRRVMTPAVSMDDITDKRARDILCTDMYTSATTRAQREAVAKFVNVQAPLSELPAPANPITLEKLNAPFVSPEWRMETVTWDNKQLRAHCDPTRRFWLAFPLPKCRACDETAAMTSHRIMLRQQKRKY